MMSSMRLNMMVVRTLTAAVLFLMLAQVNVWVNTQTHLVLAVGYRAFLIGAPLFVFLGLSGGMRTAVALTLVSTVASMFFLNSATVGVFALGMAVSGYLAKSVAAHTSQGAADNKVSLNIGSLMSGLMLITMSDRTLILGVSAVLLAVALFLSFRVDWNSVENEKAETRALPLKKPEIRLLPLLGWLLIGIATGIKLTGIFAILPQYLIAKSGGLPKWFGMLVIFNSLLVIVAQHRVLAFLDRARTQSQATFLMSVSAMALLALPAVFKVELLTMSIAWIVLLTLGECALSRYDRVAKEAGYLFPKELMVGVGSFVTVALSRSLVDHIYLSGLVGAACLVAGNLAITSRKSFFKRTTAPIPNYSC